MKKELPSILTVALALLLFTGCKKDNAKADKEVESENVQEDDRLGAFLENLPSNVRTNPASLSEEELNSLAKKLDETNLPYEELTQTLQSFFSLNSQDAEKIFRTFQPNKPEISKALNQATASTKPYDLPFHLAALKGKISLGNYFQDLAGYDRLEKSRVCDEESFPSEYGYRFSFRLTTSSHFGFKERIEGGGCQYVLFFSKEIKSWNTLSPRAIAMISAHGLGGRLHSNRHALFIDIGTATAFGFELYGLYGTIHAVKK